MSDQHPKPVDIKKASAPAGQQRSPCIRNCCLDQQDICLGCLRSLDEILAWSASSDLQQREILLRCRQRKQSASG